MSFTSLIYHVVFSTKDRRPFLAEEALPRTCQYIGGIICNQEGIPLAVNGTTDHVHVAAVASPKIAISDFVGKIKANSSGWIHETFPGLREFRWQDEYSAFTVSQSVKDSVVTYIMDQ